MPRFEDLSNQMTNPVWLADYGTRNYVLPAAGILDASQFNAPDAVVVTVGGAGAAQAATSIPVAALSGPIPSGTTLRFGADEYATLTSAAAAGATSLAVAALVSALEAADTSTYPGTDLKSVPSGTLVGRTLVERDAGTGYGPAAAGDVPPLGEIYFLWNDVPNAALNADCELVRPGATIKENKLPFTFSGLASGVSNYVREHFRMIWGAD